MLTDFEREHPVIVASPGGILWIDRARHLPQRRDRICGAANKGEGLPGTSDGGRSSCERQRGRVDYGSGQLGAGPEQNMCLDRHSGRNCERDAVLVLRQVMSLLWCNWQDYVFRPIACN